MHAIVVFQKEIQTEFQHITSELGQLVRNTQKLRENIEKLPGSDRDTELQGKLTRLNSKLNEYVKEARTRETLSSALLSEEEKLKTKLIAMEAEQVCCIKLVKNLFLLKFYISNVYSTCIWSNIYV